MNAILLHSSCDCTKNVKRMANQMDAHAIVMKNVQTVGPASVETFCGGLCK